MMAERREPAPEADGSFADLREVVRLRVTAGRTVVMGAVWRGSGRASKVGDRHGGLRAAMI